MSPLPPYIDVIMILASIASALVGFQRWTARHQRPQALTGALLMWCGSLWILSNTLQLMSPDLPSKLFWTRIQFVAIIPVPFLWFYLSMQFTGLDRLFTRRRIALLCVPPIILLVLLMSDPLHHLLIARALTVDRGAFHVLEIDYGPALWAYFAYGHFQVIVGSLILAGKVVRTPGFRWQGTALLLGVLLTVTANMADVLKLGPRPGFELTPLALLVCVPLFVFALLRFQRADLLPVARSKVIEDMQDGLVVLDAQDRILDLNPSAARILGTSLRRSKGTPIGEIWPQTSAAGGSSVSELASSSQARLVSDDQEHVYDVSNSPLRDWRGQLAGRVLALRDVSSRLEAERALRQSEERLRGVFENTLVGIYQITPEGRLLFANPALARMLGRETPAELHAGESPALSSLPGWGPSNASGPSPEVFGRIHSWKRSDGTTLHVRVNARPVNNAEGIPQFIEGTVEDVTRLFAAQEDLGRKARYLTALNRVIAAAGTSMDVPALLTACLRSTMQALGLQAGGAWVGKEYHFVALPEDLRLVLDSAEVDFERAVTLEDVAAIPPGLPSHALAASLARGQIASAMAFPVFSEGRRVGGLVLAATQPRTWLEEEVTLGEAIASEIAAGLHRIEMSERAHHQDRLAAVGQLAAGIAHDFNNILSAIILHAELLTDETGLSPRGAGRTRTILEQGRRASSLVAQMLDFSRRAVLETRPIDLLRFLKDQVRLLERTLPETIHFALIAEENDYFVQADPTRLQQVLLNLSTNARDAMPGGGTLTFSIQRSTFGPDDHRPVPDMPPGDWLILRVSDTGHGIPEGLKAHIFEPFFTTKAPGKGTGLGLSQVHGIVKQHEGFIGFSSAPETGTTFTVCLPAIASTQRAAADDALPLARGQGETVLLVEDEAAAREAVTDVLCGLGYQVLCARNGRQGLELIREHADEIRLVISDVVMPELGGQALYERVLQERPDLKVILMSGYPLGGTGQLKPAQQVVRLQKPLTMDTLAAAVRKALD